MRHLFVRLALQFSIVLGWGAAVVAVEYVAPPTPQFIGVALAADGSSITARFDSAVEGWGLITGATVFPCGLVFVFPGSKDAGICQFVSGTEAVVFLSSLAVVKVGDTIALTADIIKARCPADYPAEFCLDFPTVASAEYVLEAPTSPTVPVVVMPSRIAASPCASPRIDLSQSYGSGGRAFLPANVTVRAGSGAGAEALRTFLASSAFLSTAVAIPTDLLQSGQTYDVTVQLCNFVGACGEARTSIPVQSDPLPYVYILGSSSITAPVFKPVQLAGSASLPLCSNQLVPVSQLAFNWTVRRGEELLPVKQTSKDKTKFVLPPYSLASGGSYTVVLTVYNMKDPRQVSSASAVVSVSAGAVVAAVAGVDSRLLPFDGSVQLDASGSYDQDVGAGASGGLDFSWTCTRTAPSALSSCPSLSVAGSGSAVLTVQNQAETYTAGAFLLTVLVQDRSNPSRQASKSVAVELLAPAVPFVVVSRLSGSAKLNLGSSLRLDGVVIVGSTETASWTVDNNEVVLDAVMQTPRVSVLTQGASSMPLVLPPNTLSAGFSYVFTLRCGVTSAPISVRVNGPPRPGSFGVTPGKGEEASTPFSFAASLWTDEDVPVQYEFGFVTDQGTQLVLQPRGLITSLATSLPAGSGADNFKLTAYLKVFDALGASQRTTAAVAVRPAASQAALLTDLSNSISSAGTVDTLKQALSIATSSANRRNCSAAPDCAQYNRHDCSLTADTCGECLEGFYGDLGDQNTVCVDGEALGAIMSNRDSITCAGHGDCLLWHHCSENNRCVPDSKSCLVGCEDHGSCQFVHVASGLLTPICPLSDFQCSAQCSCNDGYSGPACQTDAADLAQRSTLRSQVLASLQEVADASNPTADSVLNLIDSLSAATDHPSEMTGDSAQVVLTLTSDLLISSELDQISTDDLAVLLNSLNAVLIASNGVPSDRRALTDSVSLRKSVLSAIDTYAEVMGDIHLVAGQDPQVSVRKHFRTSARVFRGGSALRLSTETTAAEAISGVLASSVSFDSSETEGDVLVAMTSVSAGLYGDIGSEDMSSNPVRIVARAQNVSKTFRVILQHNQAVHYPINETNETFVTKCEQGVAVTITHQCPGDHTIHHRCNGSIVTLSSACPALVAVSTCRLLNDASDSARGHCVAESFTPHNTTCMCRMTPSGRRRARRLEETTNEVGYLEVVAMSEYVAGDFVGTLYSAEQFDSASDVADVYIIIVMFAAMWGVGIFVTWYYTLPESAALNEESSSTLPCNNFTPKSVGRIKAVLENYVNEVFPMVYRPTPWDDRLVKEVKKNHRYLNVVTSAGSEKSRYITTIHLLTIQTMLMFLLAVFYDIQFPTDDGSCDNLREDTCEDELSLFDQTRSMCDWSETTEQCDFKDVSISARMIVVISVVVAVCTAPINLVVDFLFDDVLSAPTADAVKLNEEDSALAGVGRHVDAAKVVLRRASVSVGNAVRMASAAVLPRNVAEPKRITVAIVVPRATTSAQSLAVSSTSHAFESFQAAQDKYETNRSTFLSDKLATRSLVNNRRRYNSGDNPRVSQAPRAFPVLGNDIDTRFVQLSTEIIAQRRLLKPSAQELFDVRWGLDPTGEFAKSTGAARWLCCAWHLDSECAIKAELSNVQKESIEKYEKLKLATDSHVGLELLHLFVLDILGRNSRAAQIFSSKASEDFRHTMIVSREVKWACWGLVVLLNAFFIFFTMLRGMERDRTWQVGYALACVVQFVVEILMFETIECMWVHYVIPDAASDEIMVARDQLMTTISGLCTEPAPDKFVVLDAPSYLFVSTTVASKFPNRLESMIIRSYHTYLPGQLAKKWHHEYNHDGVLKVFCRNFSVFAIIVSLLQLVGSVPSSYQRMIIHIINPLLFGALVVLIYVIVENPILIGVVLFFFGYKIMAMFYGHRSKERSHRNRTPSSVSPVLDSAESANSETVDTTTYPASATRPAKSALAQPNKSKISSVRVRKVSIEPVTAERKSNPIDPPNNGVTNIRVRLSSDGLEPSDHSEEEDWDRRDDDYASEDYDNDDRSYYSDEGPGDRDRDAESYYSDE